ncbi:ABC-F family ATP-binding cassette domain-containing protein [Allofustis seminis]|uniref:ABC-F family ATP-binding cassette domain-containing protein n=1 Tax=Allofustis seminis TaxID=166939 RepID=UPI000373FC19|nr:ABC-F family ATP-binding cassette domain-containing protein [Allofustis seminis]
MLIQASNVTRRFGGVPLFEGINVSIKKKSRIGLVGRNGTGKTTLLKIIAGIELPDEGQVIKNKSTSIGYLDQHTGLDVNKSIYDEMLSVFEPLIAMEAQMRQVEKLLGQTTDHDNAKYHDLLMQYHQLQENFERQNGYAYPSEIKKILSGFRFDESMYQQKISTLSGGQKTRLALAKLLLEQKDVLILDEPTNHLDIETLRWLENYLKSYPEALVLVSHDRYFLDELTQEIYEMDHHGVLNHYHGNYTDYLKLRAERIAKEQKDYEKQQKEIAHLEDFIQKNIVRSSTTKRAQSRRKKLEKMDRLERPTNDQRSMFFHFHPARMSGNVILKTDNLDVGFGDNVLLQHVNLDIRRGDVIALVGPNGTGKTTLLKTLIGKIPALGGTLSFGAKVDIGYYDQEQKNLSPHQSVLEELWNDHPLEDEETIRTFLGSFLFTEEDVNKKIEALSGGERARLLLAKLALGEYNFLLMDEPTNHLDIDSKEVLENALIDFDGTLLFVSHDRYFINKMANKILEVDENKLQLYLGDYDYYLHKKEEQAAFDLLKEEQAQTSAPASSLTANSAENFEQQKERQRKERRLKREFAALEEKISELTKEIESLEHLMLDPALFENEEKARHVTQKHQTLIAEKEKLNDKWEALFLEIESFL